MPTITKKDLIDRTVESTHTKRITVKTTIQRFLDEIVTELARNNRLEFRDFGVFEPRTHADRTGQNPRTLEQVQVPAKRAVKLKIGRIMKQRLNSQALK